jgi:hypothetical protein
MSSKVAPDRGFDVIEHVIPAQHIRGYPHSAKDPSAVLSLAVKQYVPRCDTDSSQDSVTIIGAHANGIAKETYEPLWEELNARLKGRIRGIWIADCSHQGASGVLNEHVQGDDRMFSSRSSSQHMESNNLLSKLVRSFQRSSRHGQSIPSSHPSSDHRCRAQHGMCSTVSRHYSPGRFH